MLLYFFWQYLDMVSYIFNLDETNLIMIAIWICRATDTFVRGSLWLVPPECIAAFGIPSASG